MLPEKVTIRSVFDPYSSVQLIIEHDDKEVSCEKVEGSTVEAVMFSAETSFKTLGYKSDRFRMFCDDSMILSMYLNNCPPQHLTFAERRANLKTDIQFQDWRVDKNLFIQWDMMEVDGSTEEHPVTIPIVYLRTESDRIAGIHPEILSPPFPDLAGLREFVNKNNGLIEDFLKLDDWGSREAYNIVTELLKETNGT